MVGLPGSSFDLAFSHNFCLRDVAWIHPAYAWTKRGLVGTTSPTVLASEAIANSIIPTAVRSEPGCRRVLTRIEQVRRIGMNCVLRSNGLVFTVTSPDALEGGQFTLG
jgi:hypothetical protein